MSRASFSYHPLLARLVGAIFTTPWRLGITAVRLMARVLVSHQLLQQRVLVIGTDLADAIIAYEGHHDTIPFRIVGFLTGEDPSYHALRPWSELNLAILHVLFDSGCSYKYNLGPAVQNTRLSEGNGQHQRVNLKLYRPGLYTRLLARLDGTLRTQDQVLFSG
jgi:hypothetical protein